MTSTNQTLQWLSNPSNLSRLQIPTSYDNTLFSQRDFFNDWVCYAIKQDIVASLQAVEETEQKLFVAVYKSLRRFLRYSHSYRNLAKNSGATVRIGDADITGYLPSGRSDQEQRGLEGALHLAVDKDQIMHKALRRVRKAIPILDEETAVQILEGVFYSGLSLHDSIERSVPNRRSYRIKVIFREILQKILVNGGYLNETQP